jgi:hypothetical protein
MESVFGGSEYWPLNGWDFRNAEFNRIYDKNKILN